jgi:hypothetical protein
MAARAAKTGELYVHRVYEKISFILQLLISRRKIALSALDRRIRR